MWLIAAVLLPAAVSGVSGPALGARAEAPSRLDEWYRGPARYLMTASETKRYRRLETDAERLSFIRRFWERRDPDPRTPQNEARLAFWTRVAESNRLFNETPRPGWKTDRGKIYVLLGPPDDIERKLDYDTGIRTAPGRGLLRWHYHGLERAATRAVTVIAFLREPDEDWTLTADPRLSSIFLDVNAPEEMTELPGMMERFLDEVPWGGGSLGTAMDLGRLQEVPTERDLLQAVVRAEQFLGTYRGRGLVHQLAGPPGAPVLAITVALRKAEIRPEWDGSAVGLTQRFAVSAQLRPEGAGDDERLPIEIPDEAWAAQPSADERDPWLRFQAIRAVPPGRWQLAAVIFDRPGGGAATIYESVEVEEPDPGQPRMNGPVLASALIPAGRQQEAGTVPFRMRDHVVVPRMDRGPSSDEGFRLYLEVFPPPGGDRPVLLRWQFYRLAEGEDPAPFGSAGRLEDGRGPRAWDLPPGQMPPGRYRVTFVASAEGSLPLTRSLDFEIRAADEPDPSL